MSKFDVDKYCIQELFSTISKKDFISMGFGEILKGFTRLKYTEVIYAHAFVPFILNLINKEKPTDTEEVLLKHSFELIEELLKHENTRVNMTSENTIHNLLEKLKPTSKIEKYLLPRSLEFAKQRARDWFHLDPSTWEKDVNRFNYNEYCLEALFNKIPELNSLKGDLKAYLDDLIESNLYRAYLVYESVFRYMVLDLMRKSSPTEIEKGILKRSFQLIEDLLCHKESDVRCLAKVGFLEGLLSDVKDPSKLEQHLLPKSLEVARNLAQSSLDLSPYTWEKEEGRCQYKPRQFKTKTKVRKQ